MGGADIIGQVLPVTLDRLERYSFFGGLPAQRASAPAPHRDLASLTATTGA
jgi:hypothetical protein